MPIPSMKGYLKNCFLEKTVFLLLALKDILISLMNLSSQQTPKSYRTKNRQWYIKILMIFYERISMNDNCVVNFPISTEIECAN